MNAWYRTILFLFVFLAVAIHTAWGQSVTQESEPNNSLASANPFTIGATLNGSLDFGTTPDDSDWFTFTTEVNGSVRFVGLPQSTLAIGLELWKEGMNWPVAQVGHWVYVGVNHAIEYPNLAKGTYHFRVVRHGESFGSYEVQTQLKLPPRASGEDAEPNDSMHVAIPVNLNTTITGHIGYSDFEHIDQDDWYSLTTDVNGALRLHGIPDSTLAMVMHLWNEDMAYPMAEVGHAVYIGLEKTLVFPNLMAGTYKLRVNYASTYGSYEIFLGFQPSRHAAFEQNEPNDEPSLAIPLTPGFNVSSTIGFTDGVNRDLDDWYRFNITEDGLIRLKTHPDSTLAAIITLYTTGDHVITQSGHYSFLGMDRVLEVANLRKGEYLVRITNGEFGSYDLILEYDPEFSLTANDVEPNDSFQQASIVPVNSEFSGRLGFTDGLTTDEVDYFRFETLVTGPASIRAIPDSNMAVSLQLFNDQQSILANAGHYSFIGQTATITIPELNAGVYILNVGRGGFGSYRVLIETQDIAIADSNDTFDTATPIQIGSIYVGSLASLPGVNVDDMEDWYSFSVPFDGAFTMIIQPDSANLNTWAQLARADGFIFKSSDPYENLNIGEPDTLAFHNLTRGEYTIRVTGNGIGSYHFQTIFEPMLLSDGHDAADAEPNDGPDLATWIPVNTLLTGHLGYDAGNQIDLEDWYRFNSAGGPTEIHFQAYHQLGAVLRLYNEAGSYVTSEISSNVETPATMVLENLEAGFYRIQIHRWGTGGVNDYFGPYTFLVSADSVIIEPEPLLSGRITNAVTGEPIAGAFVMIGTYEVMTDENGVYRFFELPESPVSISFTADTLSGIAPFTAHFQSEIRSGFATIMVVADGFAPFVFNGLPIGETMVFDASLSPELIDADMRFVLNWGPNPRDLDSHMQTPDGHHVFFANSGSATEAPYVILDHDITSGYGPETITLVQRTPGTYHYYVYLYAGEGSIATSGAVVQIYDRDGLLMSVEPPSFGEDRYWYVATIDGATGRITLINELTPTEPGTPSMTKSIAKSDLPRSALISEWSYYWDFGDRGTSTDSNPSHTYLEPGLFDVSLEATHTDGRSGFFLRRNYVRVEADTTVIEEPTYILSGLVTDASTGAPVPYAYVFVANEETMTDSTGFYGFEWLPEPTPQIRFEADVTQGLAPLPVTFTSHFRNGYYTVMIYADAYDSFIYEDLLADTLMIFNAELIPSVPDTTMHAKRMVLQSDFLDEWLYFWSFGDGGQSEDASPTHMYLEPGIYSVFVEAVDSSGRFTWRYRENYIMVEADSVIIEPEPLLSGRITNAVNGEPIAGAMVEVAYMHTVTDSSGVYRFFELPETSTQVTFSADTTSGFAPLQVQFTSDLREGYHTIVVTAEGFASFSYSGLIVDEATIFDLSLSPILVDADLRFVLNWSAIPRDLDSHMKTPDGYEVYYGSRGNATEAPFVTLDHDITSGYGPETITLVNRINGTYHYFIHNYSGEADITTSLAVVQIYDRQGLLESLEIPVSGEGRYWHVADVDGATGRIDIINRIQDTAPGSTWMEKRTTKSDHVAVVGEWSYEWTFGDQNTSTEPNPLHIYTTPGVYSVSLTASLEDHLASFTRRDFIHVLDPIADIQAINDTMRVVAGTIVRIHPMANDLIPNGMDVHFVLDDWGTNHGLLMPTADHKGLIYASAINSIGIDSLRYTLYHERGQSSASIYIHVIDGMVRNQAPIVALPVEISILEDSTLSIPLNKLVFDDHDAITDLRIIVASVNPAVHVALDSLNGLLILWADENWWGTSVLTMSATDREGATSTDHVTLTFIPVNDAPVAIFVKMAEQLTDQGLIVDFQDQSHDALDPEGAITAWMWDFGDGNSSTARHARHTYTSSGTFVVRLTVTDNAGATSFMETTIVSTFTSIDEAERITAFRLCGAYPNPFNPTTMIRIDVPEAGDVVIEVYTSMGQRVATLREALTAGSHRVQVDAIGWSSGVYLYTVRYRDQMANGKMTLIK